MTRENAVPEERLRAYGITAESWADDIRTGVLRGWVARQHRRIVGYCFGAATTGEVVVLALLPHAEGQGLGKRLLQFVIDDLRARGHHRLFLGCAADPAVRSYGFYRHLGWQSTGTTDGHGDEVLELLSIAMPSLSEMSPRPHFPQAVPELSGDLVHLRELTEADLPAWFERATDAESAALAGDPIPASIELGLQLLQRNRERLRQQTGIRWAIVPAGSLQSVGSIGLAITSEEHGVAELGIVVGRACWGKGLGTCAARLVTRYAFDTLGLVKIKAELLSTNVASRRMLEKSGFRFDSVIPDFEPSDTGSLDGHLYVIRRQDGEMEAP